ncbi:hypothetical protein [Nocardioides marmotae]|uniref:hypothetical protein n=1 Tax=Nocardioides marmotae TaxID=2663857 RepID=UPI0012B5231B|nr:hypothetical protein [Nocardioides marmotae]MBC9732709.1 hypothetical protein [Nocardioides marmotae]MTB83826.1 hypothetical protein [Nocardioides marmotae]
MSDQPVRPRQATMSAWMIMGGSLFVVLSVFERVSGLTSLETREGVEEFLAVPPGDGLGLETGEVLDVLRVLSMTAGACAAAMAVLGFYVLQRSRSSRVALSLLAVPLFVTGMAVGGFVSSVVAAAVVVLWMQPTRSWFDGTEPPARPERPERGGRPERAEPAERVDRNLDRAADAPAQRPAAEPRAWQGFGTSAAGQPAQQPGQQPGQHYQPQGQPWPPAGPPAAQDRARPPGVVWACVLTWVGTGLAALGMGMAVLAVLAAPEFVTEQVRRSGDLQQGDLSSSAIRDAVLVTGVLVIVWSVLAAVAAAFAWRGAPWARIVLVVSASLASVLCLASVLLGDPLALAPLAICVAALLLLARPEARRWFATAPRR